MNKNWIFILLIPMSVNAQKTREYVEKINNEINDVNHKVTINKEDVHYSYGWHDDNKNFSGNTVQEVKGVLKKTSLFLNFHGTALLGPGGKGQRTNAWVTPYDCILAQTPIFRKKHAHKHLALLKQWSGGMERPFVSFIIIPKDTAMHFKIGYAAEQKGGKESETGGGVQMRLAYLPKNAIMITKKLNQDLNEKSSFGLDKLLVDAIDEYNKDHKDAMDPKDLMMPESSCISVEEYVKEKFDVI